MATNLRACGDVYDYTVPTSTTIISGQAFLIGERLAVAIVGGVSGDIVPCQVEGVFTINKATGGGKSFTQGQKVYWDDTAKVVDVTDNTGANKMIGWAYAAASTAATTLDVDLVD
jgi:predicted RecA/RadA family phage recombinase